MDGKEITEQLGRISGLLSKRMEFREFIALTTIALIQGNAAGISARDPEKKEDINPQKMIWSAVSVARGLEASGLSPWGNNSGYGHKNAKEALVWIAGQVKEAQARAAENVAKAEEATKKAAEAGMDINIVPEVPTKSVLGLEG